MPPRYTFAELLVSCCDGDAPLPALANCNERRGAADNGLSSMIKYLRRTTFGATGIGLGTTTKYLRGAARVGLSTTIKLL
jgi:hypothetical protein